MKAAPVDEVAREFDSLNLLKNAVARANVNPLFAQEFMEAAALLANGDAHLRATLDAALASRSGPRTKWTLHEKKLVVDLYDRYRRRLSAGAAYEALSAKKVKGKQLPGWPQHTPEYWKKKISEFRRDIKAADPHYFSDTEGS